MISIIQACLFMQMLAKCDNIFFPGVIIKLERIRPVGPRPLFSLLFASSRIGFSCRSLVFPFWLNEAL
jgi:hypothetical protein